MKNRIRQPLDYEEPTKVELPDVVWLIALLCLVGVLVMMPEWFFWMFKV